MFCKDSLKHDNLFNNIKIKKIFQDKHNDFEIIENENILSKNNKLKKDESSNLSHEELNDRLCNKMMNTIQENNTNFKNKRKCSKKNTQNRNFKISTYISLKDLEADDEQSDWHSNEINYSPIKYDTDNSIGNHIQGKDKYYNYLNEKFNLKKSLSSKKNNLNLIRKNKDNDILSSDYESESAIRDDNNFSHQCV